MPITLTLGAYSKAYPLIVNRIRASVFTQANPSALIATIIDSTPGHPERTWFFAGLARGNYGWSLDEIDGSDAVIQNLALFAVVPGQVDGTLVRDDEQPQVGVTTGFNAGDNTFTFDGTGGKPNYVGWSIVPSILTGRGILAEGLDYSWDIDTGTLLLLQSGDVFSDATYWNIHFNSIEQPQGNSYPSVNDFSFRLITANTTLTPSDFTEKLICEPAGVYMTVTLPDITTVVAGRPLYVEVNKSSICCVKFLTTGSDIIQFLRGNLYALPNESFTIYRLNRGVGQDEWRVCNYSGNFANVGQIVGDDLIIVFNKYPMNGTSVLNTQFARLYNEVVLNLPLPQVVNYDDWGTGNNKYYYSLANSANPANANKFFIPDRRGIFERNNLSGKAGDYQADQVGEFTDDMVIPAANTSQGEAGTGDFTTGSGSPEPSDMNPVTLTWNAGKENRPANYLINKYVLI